MKPIDRGDAPPFDLALFAADAVVPKDQRLALDRVPGDVETVDISAEE